MTIHNVEIANKLNKLANLLEIENANPFRVRAYRNAARVIAGLSSDVADLIAQGYDLTELPSIGEDLAGKIQKLVTTGEFPLLKQMEKRLPAVLNDLLAIQGLGPKRVQILYKNLKIKNISQLKKAIEEGKVQKLIGFGDKITQKILQGLAELNQSVIYLKLADAVPIVDALIKHLKRAKNILHIDCAGSFRRRKEVVGDLDIVVAATDGEKIIEHFVQFNEVADILAKGKTRSTVRLHSGIHVDLRVVPKKSYGAALLYFTGSKAHNIELRMLAVRNKLKLNEYGLYKKNQPVAGNSEKSIYEHFGLSYIEPELREAHGEFVAAKNGDLPTLITLKDIRGDLHCHTTATDGTASLATMAKAAEARGYDYLAITDHSKHLAFIHGLDKKALLAQIRAIDKLNAQLKHLTILKSIELDILEDGTLDLPNDILKELDFTVCAIHSHFHLSAKKQTERIIRAMDNPYFTILAHPTGRIIGKRDAYPLEMARLIRAAKERHCVLELNAQPNRLDLNDIHCQLAKEIGAKMVISTDAHHPAQFHNMQFGVYQARRGWLTKNDVLNTLRLKELRKRLKR